MNKWREVEASGSAPSLRHGHTTCTYDGKMVVFGGTPDGSGGLNDLHLFDPATNTWNEQQVKGDAPPGRYRHSATVVKDRMYVFAGYRSRALEDLWYFDFVSRTWHEVTNASGTPPTPRSSHSAVALGDAIFIFGGSGQRYSNELFIFDTVTNAWHKVETHNPPPERWCHSAVLFGLKMVIFGGARNKRSNNEMHILDLETMEWSTPQTYGVPPSARLLHSAVGVGHHMLVFGGWETRREMNDLHAFNMRTMTWETLVTDGARPATRQLHGAAFIKNEMYIFGGYTKTVRMNDLYALSCEYAVSTLKDLCAMRIVDNNLAKLLQSEQVFSEDLWQLLFKRTIEVHKMNPITLALFLKRAPYISELSLSTAGDVVTDKWLEVIAASQARHTLEVVDLTNCHMVTHEGLAYLRTMSKLKLLQVDIKNQISEDYMATLVRVLPCLRVTKSLD